MVVSSQDRWGVVTCDVWWHALLCVVCTTYQSWMDSLRLPAFCVRSPPPAPLPLSLLLALLFFEDACLIFLFFVSFGWCGWYARILRAIGRVLFEVNALKDGGEAFDRALAIDTKVS